VADPTSNSAIRRARKGATWGREQLFAFAAIVVVLEFGVEEISKATLPVKSRA